MWEAECVLADKVTRHQIPDPKVPARVVGCKGEEQGWHSYFQHPRDLIHCVTECSILTAVAGGR